MQYSKSLPLPFLLVASYLCFIIYGSLVPLDFTPHSLEYALQTFGQTKMLELGIESRADWIANGVLYVPAGFLIAEWLTGLTSKKLKIPAMILAFFICAVLAFGIEFTQIFFPPRTVSQNDIFAECIGGLIGVTLAPFVGRSIRQLIAFRLTNHETGITLILSAYLLAYVAYSLFPYDFLLSSSELFAKLNSNQWGLLFATSEMDNRPLLSIVKLGVEVAAAIPFGIFLVRRWQKPSPSLKKIIVAGGGLGFLIEAAQFFIYTGSSQGISVVTRAMGSYFGAQLWLHGRHLDESTLQSFFKRSAWIVLPIYLLGIFSINGWFSQPWGSIDSAVASLENTRLLPFYYHYYTSEAQALTSLLSVIAMFAPVGVFGWAWKISRKATALFAVILASIIETSRLFFSASHPDPTNLLIAAGSTWLVMWFIDKLLNFSPHQESEESAVVKYREGNPLGSSAASKSNVGHFFLLTIVLGFCGYWTIHFPVQPMLLGLFLLGCGIVAWSKPLAIIALVPAALPILDLAPWSGRFFLDEFDILLLITLTIGLVRTPIKATASVFDGPLKLVLGLVLLSYAISTLRAFIPVPVLDENSFSSYFSPFNALRISKGLVWAILFVALYCRIATRNRNVFRWFAWGMVLGLASTVAIIIHEKLLFGGVFNFQDEYRATGPFSAIHTGGAYIEGYLSTAVPFLILLTVRTKSLLQRIAGCTLLLATTYALMMTVSRNGFLAYAIAFSCALLATFVGSENRWRRSALIFLLGATSLGVAIPIFKGEFTQQRMSTVSQDWRVRTNHWVNGLAMRSDDWLTSFFGAGVGSFLDTQYWNGPPELHPSRHALVRDGQNVYLRIAPGNTLYVEQISKVAGNTHYRLSFDFRSSSPEAIAGVGLCEKWMLASSNCATLQKVELATQVNAWKTFEFNVDTQTLGSDHWLMRSPVKLSFFTNNKDTIELDNISLIHTEMGQEIIENGRFNNGLDHWFFTSDEHLAWHIKSLPVAILFDQGWLGLLVIGFFLIGAMLKSVRRAFAGSTSAGIFFSACMGFIIVGLFDTLIDSPRFLFLLVVIPSLAWLRRRRTVRR